MKKIIKCDLCGGDYLAPLFTCFDRIYNIKGDYPVCKCTGCGLIFINPQPEGKELGKHYPSDGYYSLSGIEFSPFIKSIIKNLYSPDVTIFKKILYYPFSFFGRSTKIIKDGNFLDIGCGAGSFLSLMKSFGMNCYGVETGEFDKIFAKNNNLHIANKTLLEAKYKNNFFDVITLNHVFEHVSNPTETLLEIKRILKPGGKLIIGVPQSDCLMYKIFKQNWVQLDVPRHLFTYSTKIMKTYAKKTGFKVEKIRYNSMPVSISKSILYLYKRNRVCSSKQGWITNLIDIVIFILLLPISILLNIFKSGDQIEVTLSK